MLPFCFYHYYPAQFFVAMVFIIVVFSIAFRLLYSSAFLWILLQLEAFRNHFIFYNHSTKRYPQILKLIVQTSITQSASLLMSQLFPLQRSKTNPRQKKGALGTSKLLLSSSTGAVETLVSPFRSHCLQVHSDLDWLYLLEQPFIGHIDLF